MTIATPTITTARPSLAAFKEKLLAASAEDRLPAVEGLAGPCSYLASNGRKCAIGLALPDDLAKKCNTIGFVDYDDVWYLAVHYLPEGLTRELAKELQMLHDGQVRRGKTWDHEAFAAGVEKVFEAAARNAAASNTFTFAA